MAITLEPIGHLVGGRTEVVDDDWGDVRATIELDGSRHDAEALAGLDAFSHLLVVYQFDRVDLARIETSARHPRNNPAWPKVGIFAQRGKNRPNRIGVSVCEILGIENRCVHVRGLDALDGTPILDIKPVMKGFEPRGTIREPQWAAEIMADYW
jgi:tRNA-Thr(GGU) m(6)t(6)A37 methyltransferase TsaA